MKVMLLAAGFGNRMRPLTDTRPKPLLSVGGRSLIEWQLLRLARAGFRDVVINHHYLGEQIEGALGDGSRWDLRIRYSPEAQILETAGGIINALPMLGDEPFLVLNADVWTDYDFAALRGLPAGRDLAHLVMVANAAHNQDGDFHLQPGGRLQSEGDGPSYTYSGIAVFNPDFFAGEAPRKLALAPLLRQAMSAGRVSGELYGGDWQDIGTPQRLESLDRQLTRTRE